jgi:hypothetical protein
MSEAPRIARLESAVKLYEQTIASFKRTRERMTERRKGAPNSVGVFGLGQAHHAHGELVFQHDYIRVDGAALRIFRMILEAEAVFVSTQMGLRGRGVENARSTAETKEDCIRAARDRGALEVEVVGGIRGLEKVSRQGAGSDVANPPAHFRIDDLLARRRSHVRRKSEQERSSSTAGKTNEC